MDTTSLYVGLIFGSVGLGYFVYGKKQKKQVAFFSGIGLMIVPYAVSNMALLGPRKKSFIPKYIPGFTTSLDDLRLKSPQHSFGYACGF